MNKEEIKNKINEVNKLINEICDYFNEQTTEYEIDLKYIDKTNISDLKPYKKYYIQVITKEILK